VVALEVFVRRVEHGSVVTIVSEFAEIELAFSGKNGVWLSHSDCCLVQNWDRDFASGAKPKTEESACSERGTALCDEDANAARNIDLHVVQIARSLMPDERH
jgi:hypothetical protein